jgi:hypothetical protein
MRAHAYAPRTRLTSVAAAYSAAAKPMIALLGGSDEIA